MNNRLVVSPTNIDHFINFRTIATVLKICNFCVQRESMKFAAFSVASSMNVNLQIIQLRNSAEIPIFMRKFIAIENFNHLNKYRLFWRTHCVAIDLLRARFKFAEAGAVSYFGFGADRAAENFANMIWAHLHQR